MRCMGHGGGTLGTGHERLLFSGVMMTLVGDFFVMVFMGVNGLLPARVVMMNFLGDFLGVLFLLIVHLVLITVVFLSFTDLFFVSWL